MPITAVALDTLPARTRALSDDNAALAAAIGEVLASGAGASDGEGYPDRKAASKVGDHARRTFLRSKPTIPDGQKVAARYDQAEDASWHWTVYLTATKPAKAAK